MTRHWRSNYSTGEVAALVEGYIELRERADTTPAGLRRLHQLIDLRIAFRALTPKQTAAVLYHGIMGESQEDLAREWDIEQSSVSRRYDHGIQRLTEIMNQGGK